MQSNDESAIWLSGNLNGPAVFSKKTNTRVAISPTRIHEDPGFARRVHEDDGSRFYMSWFFRSHLQDQAKSFFTSFP